MEVKEGGMVIIKGDNIENGGLKVVHNHGQEHEQNNKQMPLTQEELKKKVDFIKSKITAKKQYFSVCRYMMWHKMVPEGDFKAACDILNEMYPEIKLDYVDINKYYLYSFKKSLEEWDINNAPVQGTTFNKYYIIAELMDAL